MKRQQLSLEQGTEPWKVWRRSVIGASEAPIILGLYAKRSPWEMWEEKVYGVEQQNLFIFNKGHEIESKVRAHYELDHGDFPPMCFQKGIFGASLDGWNGTVGLEIKYVSDDAVDICPPRHMAQLMQQMYVTDTSEIIYIPCSDKREGEPRKVQFDKQWWTSNVKTLNKFWRDVTKARLRLLQPSVGPIPTGTEPSVVRVEGEPQASQV